MLDRKSKRILKNSVFYTIMKYKNYIDWSVIADRDILAYRHLLVAFLKLDKDRTERIKKNGLIKK